MWQALGPHDIPQPPQFERSTLVFVHLPAAPESSAPQSSNEPGHAHPLAPQICPGSHLFPQLPQFAGLLVVLMQSGGVPHSEVFAGHMQTPAAQVRPPVQVIPHPPQFAGSVARVTQAPAQGASPLAQVAPQAL